MAQLNIEDLIPIGKANAIHQKDLAQLLGVTPATAKTMVRNARADGVQILSGSCGYYMAESDNDTKEFFSLMKRHAFSTLKTIKNIKCSLNETSGQITLSDIVNKQSEEDTKHEP